MQETSNLKLKKWVDGDQVRTYFDALNNNMDKIDVAVKGTTITPFFIGPNATYQLIIPDRTANLVYVGSNSNYVSALFGVTKFSGSPKIQTFHESERFSISLSVDEKSVLITAEYSTLGIWISCKE